MALAPYFLADTSALARIGRPEVSSRLVPLIEAGLVGRCAVTDLEAGYSSRNTADHQAMRASRSGWPIVEMDERVLDRAVEVQDKLASQGQHRGVKIADLLVAAAAEASGLVVLHYDRDFDLISGVTSQPAEWVLPAGAID